jgi:hypothetical protein
MLVAARRRLTNRRTAQALDQTMGEALQLL